jgi:hypothetical protein
MRRGRGRQELSPALQIARMARLFPSLLLVDRRHLIWQGPIQPVEGGRSFILRVHANWQGTGIPRVRVLSPPLLDLPGTTQPPHTYRDGALCLYHPTDYGWSGDQFIAETMVPWACEWCFYYEHWLATGSWLGPEYLHRGPKIESTSPERREDAPRRAA